MSGGLAKALRHLRRPSLCQFLQGAHVEIAVVEESFERGHEPREKAPVLANAVAAHRRSPGFDPQFKKPQGLALGGGRIDGARENARAQSRAAMLVAIPIIHGAKRRLGLMHREYGTFGQHIEVFVGYDRRDLDDQIGLRNQAGHFQIYPNEIFWGFHGFYAIENGMVAEQTASKDAIGGTGTVLASYGRGVLVQVQGM